MGIYDDTQVSGSRTDVQGGSLNWFLRPVWGWRVGRSHCSLEKDKAIVTFLYLLIQTVYFWMVSKVFGSVGGATSAEEKKDLKVD